MSQFLRSLAYYLREHKPGTQVLRHFTEEENLENVDKLVHDQGNHELVQDKSLKTYAIPNDAGATPFSHFLDGIQRAQVLYYDGFVPVVYGYTAAAIRQRVNRRMVGEFQWRNEREALYVPQEMVDTDELKRFHIGFVGTKPKKEHKEAPSFGNMLQSAANQVANIREDQERVLAEKWIDQYAQDEQRWLVIDGSIAEVYERACFMNECAHLVGITKSHQTQYFNRREEMMQIFQLKPGERSSVFVPLGKVRKEVYSWYVRMRWQTGAPITFGLVRVEMPPTKQTLEVVDKVSAWLIQERMPVSLPDERYDRLIYPIYDVEQYLKSLAPTHTMIQAALAYVNSRTAV